MAKELSRDELDKLALMLAPARLRAELDGKGMEPEGADAVASVFSDILQGGVKWLGVTIVAATAAANEYGLLKTRDALLDVTERFIEERAEDDVVTP